MYWKKTGQNITNRRKTKFNRHKQQRERKEQISTFENNISGSSSCLLLDSISARLRLGIAQLYEWRIKSHKVKIICNLETERERNDETMTHKT